MSYRVMRHPAHPHGVEMPYVRAFARKLSSRRIDPRQWALTFAGAVIGLIDYKDADDPTYGAALVLDVASNGKYLRVQRLTSEGGLWGKAYWMHSCLYYRLADSLAEFKLRAEIVRLQALVKATERQAESVRDDALGILSQNTVTKALVHAYDNDYCHETAVALISAGHKMPDVELVFNVSMTVSVSLPGNSSYYALRKLFGATRGDVDGASGVDFDDESRSRIDEMIREQLQNGEIEPEEIEHVSTSVDWHAPILRMTDAYTAAREISY